MLKKRTKKEKESENSLSDLCVEFDENKEKSVKAKVKEEFLLEEIGKDFDGRLMKKNRKKKAPSVTRNMKGLRNVNTFIKDEEDSSKASLQETRPAVKPKRVKVLDDSQEGEPSPTAETKTCTKAARLTEDVNPILYGNSNRSSGRQNNVSPHFGIIESGNKEAQHVSFDSV